MEDFRNNVRETLSISRQFKRESLLDRNRNIEPVRNPNTPNKDEVMKIADFLKRKIATSEDLLRLKELFLENKENGDIFLKVDGALEALVTALSGQVAKLQMGAAYCLCNLALGDKFVRIAKVAGPYLLVHLSGMNTYLIELCAWTLGNLSSHSATCIEILKQQGALRALIRLLSHEDENVVAAASYALSHFLYNGYDSLNADDLNNVVEPLITSFKTRKPSVSNLMSLLSSSQDCRLKLLQSGIHIDSLEFLISIMKENILHCAWHVRIIANLIAEDSGRAAIQVLSHQVEAANGKTMTLFGAIEHMSTSGQMFLIRECCWLLGNLLNHKNKKVGDIVIQSGFLSKMVRPVRLLLTV